MVNSSNFLVLIGTGFSLDVNMRSFFKDLIRDSLLSLMGD